MTPWTDSVTNMVGFDLETTGTDVFEDRIVTASVVTVSPGKPPVIHEWLVNPGVPIPTTATAVHGITDEQAATGCQPAEMLEQVVTALSNAMDFATQPVGYPIPIVAFNAAFDLSMLRAECVRHGVAPLDRVAPVIDPYVIDKRIDKFRRGSRKLGDMAAHYGVIAGTAHESTGDVLTTLRLVWCMAQRCGWDNDRLLAEYADRRDPDQLAFAWSRLAGMTVHELHDAQVGWYAEQAESLADYRRSQAMHASEDEREALLKAADTISTEWPMRSAR